MVPAQKFMKALTAVGLVNNADCALHFRALNTLCGSYEVETAAAS